MKFAIIGAGISGLSAAHFLKESGNQVTLYEKEATPGGLIRCKRMKEGLYHLCGGHVFNSKRKDVLDWFWNYFDQEREFHKADRNSVVFMENNSVVPYPIENHVYLMEEQIQKSFIKDLLYLSTLQNQNKPSNFEEFLRTRFGETLYKLYFQPYNEKVWRRGLNQVPLSWLEGKLPMPTVEEMIYNNMNHVKEKKFVHSTFWYEKENGSQFIADRLSEGLDIRYNAEINRIEYHNNKWNVKGQEYDAVLYCGNIKNIVKALGGVDLSAYIKEVEDLEYHGTTSVFCEIDANPYSWIYQPSHLHQSHRIICTGNFAESNNAQGKMTATIEFTDEITKDAILDNLQRIPLNPRYITHTYNKYTYPIQDAHTRDMIKQMKSVLSESNFYFTGRFADWEYYNMDVAIGAAMDTCKAICKIISHENS